MTTNPFLEAALKYAGHGWKVFPCRPRLKVPITTHGVKDATADEGTIRAWWSRWPSANVALACGLDSGVYVVDVDVDPEKGVDGWATLKSMPRLPKTVMQVSPRGGAHYLFKAATPPRNKNSLFNGIDIRCEGYYIVLAPSIHPNGKAYEWAPGYGPGEIELAEFPDFMRPQAPAPVSALPWEKKPAPVQAPSSPNRTSTEERARLYLRECDPAIEGQGGGGKLLWAARAMVVGFELDRQTAMNLLLAEFNPRCVPPWNTGSSADMKDFTHKINDAIKTPGSLPRGWLLEENGLRDNNDPAVLEYGSRLASGLLNSKTAKTIAKTPEILTSKPKVDAGEMPDWILNPPGLVGELTRYINATAGCYQPKLALAAAITACGALFGRKVRDQSNGRTNIYMMGVAHSSAGKDHPADAIEQLFSTAGASGLLGGSRVTSDTAIELSLSVNPVQLYMWDELGHMFQAIKQAGMGGGSGQHLRTIVPTLMQLYSSAHKLYIGKQKAEEELRRIDQPHVCVWGLTSPDILFQSLSTSELRDGWLGRVITVISTDRPKYRLTTYTPPPESLVSIIQAWITRQIPAPEGEGDIRGTTGCFQLLVPTQAPALKVFEDFRDECYDKMISCDRLGDDTQFLWGKALQNARRVAMILATGDRYDNPEITDFHAKYACEFIRICLRTFQKAVKENVSDNVWEAEKQKIVAIISKDGPDGISKSELTRRTFFLRDKKTRDAYLADLIEGGTIVMKPNPKQPKSTWLWKTPWGLDTTTKEDGQ